VSRLFEPVRYGIHLELWYRDGMYCPGRLRDVRMKSSIMNLHNHGRDRGNRGLAL